MKSLKGFDVDWDSLVSDQPDGEYWIREMFVYKSGARVDLFQHQSGFTNMPILPRGGSCRPGRLQKIKVKDGKIIEYGESH